MPNLVSYFWLGAILLYSTPQRHLVISGVTLGCYSLAGVGAGWGVLLTSSKWRPWRLLTVLQWTGKPSQQRLIWHKMSVVLRLRTPSWVLKLFHEVFPKTIPSYVPFIPLWEKRLSVLSHTFKICFLYLNMLPDSYSLLSVSELRYIVIFAARPKFQSIGRQICKMNSRNNQSWIACCF